MKTKHTFYFHDHEDDDYDYDDDDDDDDDDADDVFSKCAAPIVNASTSMTKNGTAVKNM